MGNLTATISDHLPEFAIIPNMFGNITSNHSNFMKQTDTNLIVKNLSLTIFLLSGRIC